MARADRDAMNTYGHALDVLANITHTRDAPVQHPSSHEPEDGRVSQQNRHESDERAARSEDSEDSLHDERGLGESETSTDSFSHLPPPPDAAVTLEDSRGNDEHDPGSSDDEFPDDEEPPHRSESEPVEETQRTNAEVPGEWEDQDETDDSEPEPVPMALHDYGRSGSSTVRRVLVDDDGETAEPDEEPDLAGADTRRPPGFTPPPGSLQPKVELRPPPIRWAAPKRQRSGGGNKVLATVALLVLIVGGVGLARVVTNDDGESEQTAAGDQSPTTTEDEEPESTEPTDPPPPEPELEGPIEPDEVIGDTAAFGVPGPFELTLTASAPCWVSLTDAAGNVLIEETLQDGDEHTVEITDGSSLRVGNAGALSVRADGLELVHGGGPGEAMTLEMTPT